jgi:sugar lactone lactonase YvrE
MEAELLLDARAELGEGPTWDSRRGVLHWVDILAGRLHTYDPAAREDSFVSLGEPIGCAARRKESGFVLGLRSGIWGMDPATGRHTQIATPEPDLPGNRFNDGKCDPGGRFLAGTMDNAESEANGSLYSFTPDGKIKRLLSGLRISNGLTWNPSYNTFYFIDTPTRMVVAYDYDMETGGIAHPRPVVRVPEEMGWPDGMTSDQEGMLWVAMWGGAKITRWNPVSGNCIQTIPLPARNVTSCVFGGAELSDLYITTARKGMTSEQLARQPLSGGLFRIKTEVKGIPTFEFGSRMG